MSPSLITLVVVAINLVVAHHTKHHHVKAHRKAPLQIIGGNVAKSGDYPYQVSMHVRKRFMGGGSIIGANWVLTAYHCVQGLRAEGFTVVAGEVLLNQPGTAYEVAEIINHEKPDLVNWVNDISLLRLKKDIVFNEKVNQISFECPAELVGKKGVASGWGLIEYPRSKYTNDLMYLDNLTVLSKDDCKSKVEKPDHINDGSLCTLYKKGKGLCYGDSGGPIVIDGFLCGVVSWGKPCATGVPDVFMRVSYFNAWIKGKMNKAFHAD